MIPKPLFLSIVGALLATGLTSHAETWEVLLPSPTPGAAPTGLGRDLLLDPFDTGPAPGVFLATEKLDPLAPSIFRLTPVDSAASSYVPEGIDGGLARVNRLAYRPGDGIYAAGHANMPTGPKGRDSVSVWKVLRSDESDRGDANTWDDTDTFFFSSKSTAYRSMAMDTEFDDAGNAFVFGSASDGRANHWVIRKRSLTGPWTTLRDVKAADAYSTPYNACLVPAGGNNPEAALFVVGILNDRWTVWRSHNHGASWQAVGPWPDNNNTVASAYDVAADSQGNIYVAGVRGRDGGNRGWVLRASDDGGTTWVTLLDQPSLQDSWVVRLAIDLNDNITLAGAIDGADGSPRWALVRNHAEQSWEESWPNPIFPLLLAGDPLSKGRGMATDPLGNLLMAGDVVDWTNPGDGHSYPGTRVGLLRLVP